MKILLLGRINAGRDMCFGKLHLLIHVKNMTHATDPELKTRVFAPSFVHIPFIPVGKTKKCQECARILLQTGSSAVRFKTAPLTNESKISLQSRSCSPANIIQTKKPNALNTSFLFRHLIKIQKKVTSTLTISILS